MPSTLSGTGGGDGEVDGHVDAAEILGGEALAIGVVELVELERDLEAVLGASCSISLPILP